VLGKTNGVRGKKLTGLAVDDNGWWVGKEKNGV
jgi:hypothetical protein